MKSPIEILSRIRPCVTDLHSITANHFLHAGEAGRYHFHLLLQALLSDINNVTIDEVNIVHAAILFKGHSKDKTLAKSYRTISTCPIVAKALDIFIRDLNIEMWNSDQAKTQFLGEGSSHELAALLLTEVIQYSLYVLKLPVFILYLDARSAFDRVMRELLVRNLYHTGTTGEELLLINNRLENRKTVVEWDGTMMGPIHDQGGLEQGGVNSGDFYKIFGKNQLQLSQDSHLGVRLARNLVISALAQADDTLHSSNNIHRLQNLVQLTVHFCTKYNVELSTEKTKLQVFFPKEFVKEVEYLKTFSPINILGDKIEFSEFAEHVGIIRSVSGNLPNILSRISSHKKALGATLHSGAARHHRGNPVAGLKVDKLYGSPVLLSGLGALVMKKSELNQLDHHYKDTLQNLVRLQPKTPRCVVFFLSGNLPCSAQVHMRQLSLFGMISRLEGSVLHQHALNAMNTKRSSNSWFHQIRDICLQYQLPHPLTTLASPPSKEAYKQKVKKKVINYWEVVLRNEAAGLPSLKFFHPGFMSLASPHLLLSTAGSSPYEVAKAHIQSLFLSGRYKTERLCRFWSKNPGGHCLLPLCKGKSIPEDVEHILVGCTSLSSAREILINFTIHHAISVPSLTNIILTYSNPNHPLCSQFFLDCSTIPEVISAAQLLGPWVLERLFKISRTWCYSLHRERLKILGRWNPHW